MALRLAVLAMAMTAGVPNQARIQNGGAPLKAAIDCIPMTRQLLSKRVSQANRAIEYKLAGFGFDAVDAKVTFAFELELEACFRCGST